ncbi:antitoxin VapB family protein [Halosimplex aquaticum]|uniref:Antitoxin VapB family protein n=1 Tax=Halosimplex aquaticum TaxID=3026162 RepID=A0ABD5Y785_9EURY|nr:antitoxin VapB family protein [Halosimplex aquaticum]
MGTKTVRLDDDVYERIKSRKRADETFSEAIDRLTSEWTLLDFADGDSPTDPDRHRELVERSERAGTEESEDRLDRLGIDTDGDG